MRRQCCVSEKASRSLPLATRCRGSACCAQVDRKICQVFAGHGTSLLDRRDCFAASLFFARVLTGEQVQSSRRRSRIFRSSLPSSSSFGSRIISARDSLIGCLNDCRDALRVDRLSVGPSPRPSYLSRLLELATDAREGGRGSYSCALDTWFRSAVRRAPPTLSSDNE